MKKIGVIADLHSNYAALSEVLDHMLDMRIVCAGDLVGYGGQPNEVIEIIKSKNIMTVLGDHDYAVAAGENYSLDSRARRAAMWTSKELCSDNLKFLEGLPKKKNFQVDGRNFYIVHGSPRNPIGEYVYPESSNRSLAQLIQKINADVIILGHTHIPMERRIQGKLIVNPGSVGQPRDRDPDASYMVLKVGMDIEVKIGRIPYNVDDAAKRIKESGLPEELAMRLYFGW